MLGEHLLIFLLGLAVALVFAFSWLLYTVARRKATSGADHRQCQCPPEAHRESRAADKRPAEPFLPH